MIAQKQVKILKGLFNVIVSREPIYSNHFGAFGVVEVVGFENAKTIAYFDENAVIIYDYSLYSQLYGRNSFLYEFLKKDLANF